MCVNFHVTANAPFGYPWGVWKWTLWSGKPLIWQVEGVGPWGPLVKAINQRNASQGSHRHHLYSRTEPPLAPWGPGRRRRAPAQRGRRPPAGAAAAVGPRCGGGGGDGLL